MVRRALGVYGWAGPVADNLWEQIPVLRNDDFNDHHNFLRLDLPCPSSCDMSSKSSYLLGGWIYCKGEVGPHLKRLAAQFSHPTQPRRDIELIEESSY
jgi:hypothetical protein